MEKCRDVANSGSGQMHQLQGAESLFNVWSLWLTKACPAEAVKCAEQEMDIFKQTEEPQLREASFSELRMCQTQAWFPEIHRNPVSDGFLGSSTEGVSSHVLQLLLQHLWLGSSSTREKGAQRLGVNCSSALSSITDPEKPLQPLQINQDTHTAPPGRTNSQDRQTATTAEKDSRRADSDTEGSSGSQADAPGVPLHLSMPVYAAIGCC